MDLLARLTALIEDDMPEISAMQLKDPKVKYARMPKRLRPKYSHLKAQSILMNTTNPDTKSPPVGNTVGANSRHEMQPIAEISRLIQEIVVQLANPYTSERDKNTDEIAKAEAGTKRRVKKNARKARGAPEQEFPYNDLDKTRTFRRTTVTTSQYGMGL